MIKVYVADWQIVKTINEWFFDVELAPEGAVEIVSEYDISDHIVYEDWVVKLYADSTERLDRKAELEAKAELTEDEQTELEYINSL